MGEKEENKLMSYQVSCGQLGTKRKTVCTVGKALGQVGSHPPISSSYGR